MAVFGFQHVAALGNAIEYARNGRMIDRLVAFVMQQVLLADIGDIAALRIFGEQVIKGLVLMGANILRNRLISVVAVRKNRVDIENHTAKIEHAMLDDIADRKACMRHGRCVFREYVAFARGGNIRVHDK
jgi:hypothetical protein